MIRPEQSGRSTAPAGERGEVYAAHVAPQLSRLLGWLDRQPQSASYGLLDRGFWAWKFRDCPVTMFQAAVIPLALAWRHPFQGNEICGQRRVHDWLAGALDRICRMQSPGGGFPLWGPATDHPGIALGMALAVCRATECLGEELEAGLAGRLHGLVERACEYALQNEEDYSFISNHQAHFALAFLSAAELLGAQRYRQRAEEIIERILKAQSPDGWYAEYGGPDPGYETLGISYLAQCWQRTHSEKLLDSLRRSVAFLAHFVHPDGSVGGVYGSRHTQQYFPAGLETLAGEIPMAGAIAEFLCNRLEHRNVVTLSTVDAENLAVLAGNYIEASLAAPRTRGASQPPLPCEALQGVRHFPACGLTVAGSPQYYAVVHGAKGGVCRVFNRRAATLAYEDAGYLLRAGGRLWTSQAQTATDSAPNAIGKEKENETLAVVRFSEVHGELSSPMKLLLFRALSLTLGRSARLAAWLRGRIVARLITASRPGPLRLERRVRFDANEVVFSDHLALERPMRVESAALVRSFTPIHMGSARYFHPQELRETPLPETKGLERELTSHGEARCEFRLRFADGLEPELVTGNPGAQRNASTEGILTRR